MFPRSENLNQNKRWLGLTLTAIVALAWLVQSAHLRLPIEIVKDISIPFPCQFSGCGCSDAVQCWSSCGCHTDAEKIAWAEANSVQPPEWFLEDLKTKAKEASAEDSSCGGCCCCHSKSKSKSTTPDAAQPAPIVAESNEQTSTRIVYLDLKQRRKCQGQYDVDQVALFFVMPPNGPLRATSLSPLCIRDAGLPPAIMQLPETPPPQIV